jgi:hypothetical protein
MMKSEELIDTTNYQPLQTRYHITYVVIMGLKYISLYQRNGNFIELRMIKFKIWMTAGKNDIILTAMLRTKKES